MNEKEPATAENKDSTKSKDAPKPPAPAVPVFRLWRFASKLDLLLIFIGVIFSAGVGALFPAFFLVLGDLLGSFAAIPPSVDGKPPAVPPGFDIVELVVPTVLKIVYFGIAQWVAGYVCQCFWVLSGENQAKRIRKLYVQSILRQNIGWFDESEDGSLTTRLAQDTQIIQDGISEKAGMTIQCISQFLTGFIIAFVQGWQLALVLMAAMPLLGAVGSAMIWAITKFVGKEQDAYADAGTVAEQVISGIRTVYSFSLQSRFQKRYETEIEKAFQSEVRKGIAIGGGFGGFMGVLFSTYGLAFWYGSQLVINDGMAGEDVMTVFFSMMIGAMALITVPPNLAAISSARGAAYKIFAVIDRVPVIDSLSSEGQKPEAMIGEVEFQNVCFHYPTRPDVPILRDLNLKIKKGTTVAFVGPSGSGKSTSISLIQRFYDAISGTVTIDGIDIKNLDVKWLRQHIGVVSQEPVLFNTTIKQNILMGAVGDVSEEQLIDCCKQANCHNFITALPKGYLTLVGEHGGMLSGGQKQRIAIARALIKNPKLLLLDEATSALDTTSERIVQAALDKISSTRTTIVVAHRLSTIRNANTIVVMSKGVPVERGTHDELVALGGIYNELVEKQKIKMTEGGDKVEKEVDAAALDEMEIMAQRALQTEDKVPGVADASAARQSLETVGHTGVPETRLRLEDGLSTAKSESEIRRQQKEKIKASVKAGKSPTWRVIRMMRPEWPLLGLGCIGAVVGGCVFPVFGYILGTVITKLLVPDKSTIAPGPFQGANLYAFLFVVIGVCMLTAMFAQIYCFSKAGAKMTRRLRAEVFAALMTQEVGFFDQEDNTLGALTARLATEAAAVSDMITKVWGDVIQLIFTAAAGLFIGFYHAWNLTLVVLCVVPFMAAASMYESKIHRGFEDKTKKAYELSVEVAAEAIKEIRTVAALTRESYFQDKYATAILYPHKLAQRKAYVASVGHAANQGLQMFANAVGFYAGIRFIAAGELEFSNMFVVIMAITITAQGLGRASTFTMHLTKGKLAAINTFELLDRKSKIDPNAPGEKPLHLSGEFDFKDVAFTYPARPDQPIFTGGFNLHGKPNQTVALVGPSGCGKSTTIGMLERWYDREAGSVTVDGKDVKSYHLKDGLRKHMALVGQEPVLFDISIKENILWGTDREGVQDEEIEEVAKMANIHTFVISLPQGYNTRVGSGGSQLSGGQKQRVAIARALIRKPQILLLDEATSALDSESEKLVQEAIDRAISEKNRTTITIAHRLSTIQNADVIAVVKDGSVVELGSHFELLALNGVYTGLVQQQDLNVLH